MRAARREAIPTQHNASDCVTSSRNFSRKAAVDLVERGISIKAAAFASRVHRTTIQRWVNLKRSGSSLKRRAGSGANPKLSAAHISQLKSIASKEQFKSAPRAAKEFTRVSGVHISKSTAYRALVSGGDRFWLTKVQPRLTARHKQLRINFSITEASRDWNSVMFTDSKYFQLQSNNKRHGVYGSQPAVLEKPKFGPSLHVYLGLTRRGLTELKVVSGGSTKNTAYWNRSGQLYKGLSASEYQAEVLPMFQREGERLFSERRRKHSWVLQQDGAPSHSASQSRQAAELSAPGGLLLDWPPNSPDLSLIENVWGIMAQELSYFPDPRNVTDLLAALNKVKAAIKPQVFENVFDGMAGRLKKCIDLNGATLTK